MFMCCLSFNNHCFALQYGSIDRSNSLNYSKVNTTELLKTADEYFNNALKEGNLDKRHYYLENAEYNYLKVTQTSKENIYPIIQLARVYDFEGKDKFSVRAFNSALNINPNDKLSNYYFGDFYYYRSEYGKALRYYQPAFKNGLEENHNNSKKMAIIYEKLGDLQKANIYYKKTFLKNMNDGTVADKIREIENTKYNDSDYYNRKLK